MGCGRDDDCACRIDIDDSIVVIICGDIDINTLRNSLKAMMDMKSE